MVQNRNKLIELFIGNISNSIVHKILEFSIEQEQKELASKYGKEFLTSFDLAKKYRQKINPTNKPLPDKDIIYIKNKIMNKVKSELLKRVDKGYKGIKLDLV